MRGGRDAKVTIALVTAPELPLDERTIRARSPFAGMRIANVSPALADSLRLDTSAEGVIVVDVGDNTTAQSVGFQRGDLVVEVNGQKIARTADLDKLVRDGARLWRVTIVRGGQQISAVFGG
jgi:S1-C subfamily serine protease